MSKIYYIVVFILLTLISGSPTENKPPQITDLIWKDADHQVYGGEQVIFECRATDSENDRISYIWPANSGTFNSTSSSTVRIEELKELGEL